MGRPPFAPLPLRAEEGSHAAAGPDDDPKRIVPTTPCIRTASGLGELASPQATGSRRQKRIQASCSPGRAWGSQAMMTRFCAEVGGKCDERKRKMEEPRVDLCRHGTEEVCQRRSRGKSPKK
jgi:hypothetical protein